MKRRLRSVKLLWFSLLFSFLIGYNVHAHSTDVYSGSWNATTTSLGIAVGPSLSNYLSSFQSWYSNWNGISSNVGLMNNIRWMIHPIFRELTSSAKTWVQPGIGRKLATTPIASYGVIDATGMDHGKIRSSKSTRIRIQRRKRDIPF